MKTKKEKILDFNKKNVRIGISEKGYGSTYFAKRKIKKGEVVMMGFGKIINHQTAKISIQIAKNTHYLPSLLTGRCWNHSCAPNTFPKTREDGFPDWIALKNIEEGEEICYGYWGTEYEWAKHTDEKKIECKCGSTQCQNKIPSFSNLEDKIKKKILKNKQCSKYLIDLSTTIE